MNESHPPVYLALDLWLALGLPDGEFEAYYERNGWADTWSNLLDKARGSHVPQCSHVGPDGPCVLREHKTGPHYIAEDVGSTEPLPVPEPPPPIFEYDLRLAVADGEGYYITRWDRARKITVRAATEREAVQKALVSVGDAKVARLSSSALPYWVYRCDATREVAA